MKPYLFITREIPGSAIDELRKYYDVEVWEKMTPPPYDVLLEKARKADALLTLLSDKIDCNLIQQAENLRIIAQYAVGYDNIDIDCATKHAIYVTNTPGVLDEAVADFTWGLLIGIARRIVEADNFVRSGEWYKTGTGWHPLMMLGVEVYGKTIGIIGMGRIGRAVARRAKAFDMKILYYDIVKLSRELEESLGAKYVDLDTLLRESDFVTLHVPLTKETYHLIGERELRLMKSSAYLINTSRGAIVDTEALVKALKEKWIAGAALDVFEEEPLPPDHPLTKLENVILAPHAASASVEARTKMAKLAASNLIEFYKGNIPPTLVNKDVIRKRKPGF